MNNVIGSISDRQYRSSIKVRWGASSRPGAGEDHQRDWPTIPRNPPAYDPQSNGEAERAVQEMKCQLRETNLGLEAKIGRQVADTEQILE